MTTQSNDDSIRILQLRLTVARAAQRDSLSWWDDAVLTPEADLLLRRLFPRSGTHAAWTLALRAARARHEVVLAAWPHAHHLFSFGVDVENHLDEIMRARKTVDTPPNPIRSRAELATELRAIATEPTTLSVQTTESDRTIQLGDEVTSLPDVDRAIALAWAYTVPDTASLVVPFYLPAAERTR